MEKLFYFPSSFHSRQIAPKTIPRTRTNISVMRQMPRPRAGAITEGSCWWCLRRRAICLAMVLGDGTGNWSEMELEVIRQHNSTRLQMNCDALSYEQKGCNGNSDFFENAVAILDGVMKSFCSKLVMRGSGFFPTRGSRFYEIIWPAPARPAPLYLFFQPAPPRTRDH